MNGVSRPGTTRRYWPLGQLVLARLREFYREPEAVFWVYGFPLILAVVLGIAFSGGTPRPPDVDVQGSKSDPAVKDLVARLEAGGMKVEVHSEDEWKRRLRTGATALVIVPEGGTWKYVYDETRSDSVLARFWVDSILARSETGAPGPAGLGASTLGLMGSPLGQGPLLADQH